MGPWEKRLKDALDGDPQKAARDAADTWQKHANLLDPVVKALRAEAKLQDDGSTESVGGVTGPALAAQLRRSADDTEARIADLRKGRDALTSVETAAITAKRGQKRVESTMIPSAPTSLPNVVGPPSKVDIKARNGAIDKQEKKADAEQERERIARETYDAFDVDYEPPTEKMKEIHGIPDPEPYSPGGVGSGGAIGGGAATARSDNDSPWNTGGPDTGGPDTGGPDTGGPDTGGPDTGGPDTGGPDTGGPDTGGPDTGGPDTGGPDPTDPIIVDPTDPGDDEGGFTGTPVIGGGSDSGGGLSSGAIGGLAGGVTAGGVGLAAGLKGGLSLPSSLSTSGVKSIGSMSTTGAASTLGRTSTATSGAASGGSPVAGRGTGGAASGGRGAGRGGAAGGRGAGSRGRGGAASGRGSRRSKDDEKNGDRDLFDDGDDWIDDEGAAPSTLG